ncbi:MAG: 23S rRNA (cytosine(2499)-C(5))-methyltransferase [Desulfuromonas sp.]|nr:MAG: 23S rRNA (cytosine(2499)-C(5))-methyltransferase [Desulfuromonas sp.]
MIDQLHHTLKNCPSPTSSPLRLQVSNSAAASLHRGHPWLYAEKITEQGREGRPGELAVVYDGKKRFVALGLYDPTSPLRLRALRTSQPGPIDASFFAERIIRALERRRPLLATETDGYRMIHGESDALPGLVVDRYAGTAVVKIYTLAWAPYLAWILENLLNQQPLERIVLRLSRSVKEHPEFLYGLSDGQILCGPPITNTLTCLENGLRFEVDPVRGQKTGFFLDQRDNRARVQQMAKGRTVLNAFSYNGGFSLAAARGGAREVTSLDQSGPALASSQRNFALNAHIPAVAAAQHHILEDDAFKAMARLAQQGRTFDLVIVDPPAFAVRRSQLKQALAAYGRLAHLAVKLLAKNGDIVLASCSNPVSPEDFRRTMCEAATQAGRPLRQIQETAHALDHPLDFTESRYLKCLFATC